MIDPLTSLAFGMQSGRGVYALLLGSGISKAAGIPTGWEIVLNLIARLARAQGEDPGDAPDDWYTTRFGQAPNYAVLLDALAHTSAERQQLLQPFFEPADSDDPPLKRPTKAHRAIARLVAGGFVRVLVTTTSTACLRRRSRKRACTPSW